MDSLAKKFLKSNIFFIKSAMDCDPGILPESCIDFINSADKETIKKTLKKARSLRDEKGKRFLKDKAGDEFVQRTIYLALTDLPAVPDSELKHIPAEEYAIILSYFATQKYIHTYELAKRKATVFSLRRQKKIDTIIKRHKNIGVLGYAHICHYKLSNTPIRALSDIDTREILDLVKDKDFSVPTGITLTSIHKSVSRAQRLQRVINEASGELHDYSISLAWGLITKNIDLVILAEERLKSEITSGKTVDFIAAAGLSMEISGKKYTSYLRSGLFKSSDEWLQKSEILSRKSRLKVNQEQAAAEEKSKKDILLIPYKGERWREIAGYKTKSKPKGFPGYYVSCHGRVGRFFPINDSFDKAWRREHGIQPLKLIPGGFSSNALRVTVGSVGADDSRYAVLTVSHLVLWAFGDNKKLGNKKGRSLYAEFHDGDRSNVHIDNLYWASKKRTWDTEKKMAGFSGKLNQCKTISDALNVIEESNTLTIDGARKAFECTEREVSNFFSLANIDIHRLLFLRRRATFGVIRQKKEELLSDEKIAQLANHHDSEALITNYIIKHHKELPNLAGVWKLAFKGHCEWCPIQKNVKKHVQPDLKFSSLFKLMGEHDVTEPCEKWRDVNGSKMHIVKNSDPKDLFDYLVKNDLSTHHDIAAHFEISKNSSQKMLCEKGIRVRDLAKAVCLNKLS